MKNILVKSYMQHFEMVNLERYGREAIAIVTPGAIKNVGDHSKFIDEPDEFYIRSAIYDIIDQLLGLNNRNFNEAPVKEYLRVILERTVNEKDIAYIGSYARNINGVTYLSWKKGEKIYGEERDVEMVAASNVVESIKGDIGLIILDYFNSGKGSFFNRKIHFISRSDNPNKNPAPQYRFIPSFDALIPERQETAKYQLPPIRLD